VKTWDGTTEFKESGMELVSDVQDFIGQFPLQGNLFQNFGIYGNLFSEEVPKSFLNDLGGKGNYRFEIIIKPVGAIQNDEYTIPVYLKL